MAAPLPIQSAFTNHGDQNDQELKSSDTLPGLAERVESDETVNRDAPADLAGLVLRIGRGEESGMEEFYQLFARGVRFYLRRQLGLQDVDDKVHDIFLVVVHAIQRGDLREPERLMGFVRTVLRRQVAAYIDQRVRYRKDVMHSDVGLRVADQRLNPEQNTAFEQKVALMQETLQQLSERDREILTRFYLHEETQDKICREMCLTETQFRLAKSRAKARFGELGQRNLKPKLAPVFLRIAAG